MLAQLGNSARLLRNCTHGIIHRQPPKLWRKERFSTPNKLVALACAIIDSKPTHCARGTLCYSRLALFEKFLLLSYEILLRKDPLVQQRLPNAQSLHMRLIHLSFAPRKEILPFVLCALILLAVPVVAVRLF
jgi:hypothetical protein